jgi:hypothetical protein
MRMEGEALGLREGKKAVRRGGGQMHWGRKCRVGTEEATPGENLNLCSSPCRKENLGNHTQLSVIPE